MGAVPTLIHGGVVVMLTDTIYGILGKADNEEACRRIRELKGRDADKAMIVLIADSVQIWDGVSREVFEKTRTQIGSEPTSIIVPAGPNTPAWLPRQNDTSIAFRLPNDEQLVKMIRQTGPLVAPSANPQGELPALNLKEAGHYFGDKVDLYVDAGFVGNRPPSRVARLKDDGTLEYLR